ncbi:adenylate/guanylate cyclase domain-containing protein [Piscinibacter sp.]|uniref:adenylate/guanylate cyclase domain-containing protein n=1 Tax=Piscinibacter sp. TaxID=1903157 RepID=UPI002F40B64A
MTSTQSEAQWPILRRAARTVVVVDVVESVRLIEQNEEDTVRRWQAFVGEVVTKLLPQHGGRLVKSLGDGLMVEFEAVPPAIQCAFAMQQSVLQLNQGRLESERLCLRIGAHAADVIIDELDIYGSGVNLAARLTTLAGPGEIVVSAEVRDQLVPGLDADVEDLGECFLKHFAQPIRAYRVGPTGDRPVVPPGGSSAGDLRPTIAVIPFSSYAGAPEAVGLGDILADQVIAALSKSNAINVISRLSTTAFRDRIQSIEMIGQSLSANFIVSGRYWKSGSTVHALVELADARNSRVIWTQTLADTETAVLQTDSELVAALVDGISQAIFSVEVASVSSIPLPNLQSHTLLLAAISLLYRLSVRDFERARAALETLNERAPRHPSPLAWLARWHLFRVVQGWSDNRERDGTAALSYAKRALDLDPDSSLALTMLGNVHTNYLRDLEGAESLYDKALSINPNESLAWLQKGNCLSFRGDGPAALAHTEKAADLSPLDPSRHFYLSIMASAALSAGAYERAIAAAKSSLRLNSDHVSSHRVLAIAQVLTGRVDEARLTVRQILALEPHLTVAGFIARSPGASSGLAETFGSALLAAGLPLGETTFR